MKHESSFDSHNILLDHLQTVYQPFKISTTAMFSFAKVSAIVALVFAVSTAEAADTFPRRLKATKGQGQPPPEPFSSNNSMGAGLGALYGGVASSIARNPSLKDDILKVGLTGAALIFASTLPPGEERNGMIQYAIKGDFAEGPFASNLKPELTWS